eukprot:gene28847-31327_t
MSLWRRRSGLRGPPVALPVLVTSLLCLLTSQRRRSHLAPNHIRGVSCSRYRGRRVEGEDVDGVRCGCRRAATAAARRPERQPRAERELHPPDAVVAEREEVVVP